MFAERSAVPEVISYELVESTAEMKRDSALACDRSTERGKVIVDAHYSRGFKLRPF
ncbi:MAG: hypothetical protein AB7O59_12200 [Pirellulales bacterium]